MPTDLSSPRVLITGGTGFVGPYLIHLLGPRAAKIAVLSSGRCHTNQPDVEYFAVDIRDTEAVQVTVRDLRPDHIYHLAGISTVDASWENPRLTYEVNVIGAHNLFEAAMELPTPARILNVSTSQLYAPSDEPLHEDSPVRPNNPYAASKAMAELLVAEFRGRPVGGVITARPFNHTGPGQTTQFVLSSIAKQFAEIERGVRPAQLTLGNVDVERDFTDVRDVVRAYWMLLAKGRLDEVYNVCSGSLVCLRDIVDLFQESAKISVSISSDAKLMRSSDMPRVCGACDKLRRETGWHPEIPLRRTVEDLLEYWREVIVPNS